MSEFEQWYADNKDKLHLTDRIAAKNVWQAAKQSMQGEAVGTVGHNFETGNPYVNWNVDTTQIAGASLYTHAPDDAKTIAELQAENEALRNRLGETIKTLAWACENFEASYCGFTAKSQETLHKIGVLDSEILNILGKGTVPPDQAIDAAISKGGE